ncbi:hypothetical protein H8E88_06030 [candidate division KSB1 bacterium]|nr:hypothetical protein [candidate division KSB1 bacterium]MBL7095148.1 hypothetical protein [candidate division KSB1 bacterium]
MYFPNNKSVKIISTIFVFLCLISFSVITDSQVQANPKDKNLSYKSNEGDVLIYESVRKNTRTMERGGETSDFTTTRKYDFQLKTEKVENLICFELTVNKLETSSEGGRGFRGSQLDPEKIKGKRARIKIKPSGEFIEITAIDSISVGERRGRDNNRSRRPRRRGNPVNQLRIAFFQLPDKQIKVGDSWTEDYKEPARDAGGFMGRLSQDRKVDGKSKYTVIGEEDKNGLNCYHIKVESEYSIESQGSMRGNEFNTEREGESTADIWFAYKEGILVEYTQSDFSESTTAISGEMNRTMASSGESKSTLKLVKWNPN